MKLGNTVWTTAFAVVAITITVTNVCTIVVFTGRHFKRKLSHYLPLNLTVADLLVGTIALPLYIIFLNHPGDYLNHFYQSFDITAGVTSISSIALISLERLYAIGWPLKHRLLSRKHYLIGIAFTWMYAIVFMILLRHISKFGGNIMRFHVMIWGMGLPFLVALVACVLIFVMKKGSEKNLQRRPNIKQNMKLVQTLLTIIVVFFLMWLPLTIITSIYFSSKGTYWVSPFFLNVFKVLHYSNSFANPIIYAFKLQGFRSAIKQTFCMRSRTARSVGTTSPATSRVPQRLQQLGIENAALDL